MKKSLLTLTAVLAFGSLVSFAQTEDKTETFTPVADTYLRTDDKARGGETAMEIKTNFYGLIGFNFAIPDGMKVKEATLVLVTERNKKGGEVYLRAFGNNFNDNAKYSEQASYIDEALKSEPIITFSVKGQNDKAIFDNGINEQNRNLEAWTNTLDLTSYFKMLAPNTSRVNFLITQANDNSIKFYTKENVGMSNSNYSEFTATSEELTPILTVVFTVDSDTSSDTFSPSSDTFVRSNAAGNKYGGNDNMEIYWTENDGTRDAQFYGLMSFNNLPTELKSSDYEITSATLRLVSTQIKGNRTIEIYDYPSTITDDETWNSTSATIEPIFNGKAAPVATFEAKGQGDRSMWDTKGIDAQYCDASQWTNMVDLTNYLKSKEDPTQFTILLSKEQAGNNAIRIATKEAKDIIANSGKENEYTFAADDLKPQLKITYVKKGGETSVETIVVDNSDAPVEYYNLQGVKVTNPEKGIYIMRQGTSVRKVIL